MVDNGSVSWENEVGQVHFLIVQERLSVTTGVWDLPNVHTEIVRSTDNILKEKNSCSRHSFIHTIHV